jgi:hypothetical protein
MLSAYEHTNEYTFTSIYLNKHFRNKIKHISIERKEIIKKRYKGLLRFPKRCHLHSYISIHNTHKHAYIYMCICIQE